MFDYYAFYIIKIYYLFPNRIFKKALITFNFKNFIHYLNKVYIPFDTFVKAFILI